MKKLDRLGWAVYQSYEVGDQRFNLRTTSPDFARWVGHTLSEYRSEPVDEDPAFSVLVNDDEQGATQAARRYHILYAGSWPSVKTMNLGALGRGLLAEVQRYVLAERRDAIWLGAGALLVNDRVVLVPGYLVAALSELGRRTARAGVVLPIASYVRVDVASGRITPLPAVIDIPEDAESRLAQMIEKTTLDKFLMDEELKVDFVCIPDQTVAQGVEAAPRGRVLADLVAMTHNLPAIGGVALLGLGRLVGGAGCYRVAPTHAAALLEVLDEIAASS